MRFVLFFTTDQAVPTATFGGEYAHTGWTSVCRRTVLTTWTYCTLREDLCCALEVQLWRMMEVPYQLPRVYYDDGKEARFRCWQDSKQSKIDTEAEGSCSFRFVASEAQESPEEGPLRRVFGVVQTPCVSALHSGCLARGFSTSPVEKDNAQS